VGDRRAAAAPAEAAAGTEAEPRAVAERGAGAAVVPAARAAVPVEAVGWATAKGRRSASIRVR